MSALRASPAGRARALSLGLLAALLAAFAAGPALADNPRLGGYTQPAPQPVQDKHAADVTNRVLHREGSKQIVSTQTLHTGVVLTTAPRATPRPTTRPDPTHNTIATVGAGLGPAERAGVSLPQDQAVGTEALWAIAAALMALATAAVLVHRRA